MLQCPWAPLQADNASRVAQLLSQHRNLLWGGPVVCLPLMRCVLDVWEVLWPPDRHLHINEMPTSEAGRGC